MKDFHIVLGAITSIILFIFGLENFSKEVQRITGRKFRKFLGKYTRFSGVGLILGALVTAFIQSSSATSVIAIGLVNAGVLSFKNSIGIIFGANIGTTVTAQLVAFKLTTFAPVFIISGFILSFIRSKYAIFAKSLFYFGFVFFTLNLISSTLHPLQSDDRIIGLLTSPQNIFLAVLIGSLITAVVQSSSVTTGLAIIFTQQGLMSLENAIPILMGANLGTTFTALLSIINMDIAAKKTALAHFLFNFLGVLLFLPIVIYWGKDLPFLVDDPAVSLANFHLVFNLTVGILFLFILKPFASLIDNILGEGKMDFERIEIGNISEISDFEKIEKELSCKLNSSYYFVQETYNLVTLSIETNYNKVYDAAKKRIEYFEYLRSDFLRAFSNHIGKCDNESEIAAFVKIMSKYEYLFQIHDSVKDITSIKESLDENYIELNSDLLLIIRDISSETLSIFDVVSKHNQGISEKKDFQKKVLNFQNDLIKHNNNLLKIMSVPDRNDVGFVIHLITYSQRLKDKLVHYNALFETPHVKVGKNEK